MNPERSFFSRGVAAMVSLLGGWLFLLLWLFPLNTFAAIAAVLAGAVIIFAVAFLTRSFLHTSYRFAALPLLILMAMYGILVAMPSDKYGAKPVAEVRAAVSVLIQSDAVRPDFLQTLHQPPFAPVTAALQKYRSELPEHSWMIRFYSENSPEDQPAYLFNIRNEQAGSNHPAMVEAALTEEYFVFEVMQDDRPVLYRIPLNGEIIPFEVSGVPDQGAGRFRAVVYPHMLDAGNHSAFQAAFYRLLDGLYS